MASPSPFSTAPLRAPYQSCSFSSDAACTGISTLSLHDALPISLPDCATLRWKRRAYTGPCLRPQAVAPTVPTRSEEHTSELQSRGHLVCRLLLEKKKVALDHLVPACRHLLLARALCTGSAVRSV